jgi:hypothetical protein
MKICVVTLGIRERGLARAAAAGGWIGFMIGCDSQVSVLGSWFSVHVRCPQFS